MSIELVHWVQSKFDYVGLRSLTPVCLAVAWRLAAGGARLSMVAAKGARDELSVRKRTPAGRVMIATAEVRPQGPENRQSILALALEQAEKCEFSAKESATGWSLPQALAHCAQSIEFSITGFPRAHSRIFQRVLGRAFKRRFLRRGVMLHNRAASIPGAPPVAHAVTRAEAIARLRRAVASFESYEGPCAPHFAYGPTSKAEYEALHAMHLTDHLTAFDRSDAA